jgi:hypothetical protein
MKRRRRQHLNGADDAAGSDDRRVAAAAEAGRDTRRVSRFREHNVHVLDSDPCARESDARISKAARVQAKCVRTTVLGCDVATTKRSQKSAVVGKDFFAQAGREGQLAGGRLRHDAFGPAPEQTGESILAAHTSRQTQAVTQPIARAWVLSAANAAASLASVGAPDECAQQRGALPGDLEENSLVFHAAW